jgi:Leucine-rich repeat (LRR) protein
MPYFFNAKTSLFLLIFLSFFSSSTAQLPRFGNSTTVPVYRSKADSIKGTELAMTMRELMFSRDKKAGRKMDSLFRIQTAFLQQAVLRYRTIYFSSADFVSLDSLKKVKDLSTVTKVSLEKVSEIPAIVLECNNLVALEFVNTRMATLPDLSTLSQLKTVYFFNNVPPRRFKIDRNTNITNLTIRGEFPNRLPRTYKNLPGLLKLDLEENQLTKFPNGARKNKKLIELNVQRNQLTLKGKIKTHPYLQQLGLQNNPIEAVPAGIAKFPNLRKLNFNSSKISKVDASIQKLQKLEFISFYKNNLTEIPLGVYKLSSLREIDLFHNQIEKLEPEKSNWKNLVTLYISHNKVLELPENISLFSSLEGLYAWDNRISKLPESIGSLQKLKFVRVNNNYLKVIPESLLMLKDLEELDCSRNFITHLPPAIFDFKKLKIIAFNNNPWDQESKNVIASKLEELRKREVFVHVDE